VPVAEVAALDPDTLETAVRAGPEIYQLRLPVARRFTVACKRVPAATVGSFLDWF
jgi:hypothetical protein